MTPGPAQGVKASIFASVISIGVLKASPLVSIRTVFPFAHNDTDRASENNRPKNKRISILPNARLPLLDQAALIGSTQVVRPLTLEIQPERCSRFAGFCLPRRGQMALEFIPEYRSDSLGKQRSAATSRTAALRTSAVSRAPRLRATAAVVSRSGATATPWPSLSAASILARTAAEQTYRTAARACGPASRRAPGASVSAGSMLE